MILLPWRLWARPAGLEVSGNITQDTIWNKSQSPYLVTASLQVMDNVTLTIQAGVIVKFADNSGLSVANNAQLLALGTANEPVVFTSIKDDSQGGDNNGDGGVTVPTPGRVMSGAKLGSNWYAGCASIVRAAVAAWRQGRSEVFVPLAHPPGEAQVDFGQAEVVIAGDPVTASYFVMTLPHSDAFFVRAYPKECTETF